MEKLLTTTVEGLDRFRKDAPPDAVSHEERHAREAYHYTQVCRRHLFAPFASRPPLTPIGPADGQGGSMLMRSQLDGYDERLPGTGIFDIKTRATASIRFDIENHEVRLVAFFQQARFVADPPLRAPAAGGPALHDGQAPRCRFVVRARAVRHDALCMAQVRVSLQPFCVDPFPPR